MSDKISVCWGLVGKSHPWWRSSRSDQKNPSWEQWCGGTQSRAGSETSAALTCRTWCYDVDEGEAWCPPVWEPGGPPPGWGWRTSPVTGRGSSSSRQESGLTPLLPSSCRASSVLSQDYANVAISSWDLPTRFLSLTFVSNVATGPDWPHYNLSTPLSWLTVSQRLKDAQQAGTAPLDIPPSLRHLQTIREWQGLPPQLSRRGLHLPRQPVRRDPRPSPGVRPDRGGGPPRARPQAQGEALSQSQGRRLRVELSWRVTVSAKLNKEMFVSLLSALTSDPQHDHSHQQTGRHIHRHSHHHNHKHNHGEALRDVILLSFQES